MRKHAISQIRPDPVTSIDERRPRFSPGLLSLWPVVFAVSFLAYAPILNGYFLADDFGNVQLYLSKKLADWPRLFYSDWSEGMWGFRLNELRPVIGLSFMWDGFIWKANPLGYHLTNVSIHAVNSVLIFFAMRLFARAHNIVALAGAILFGLHPGHAQAVAWISGRNDIVSTFFYLSTVLLFALYRSRPRRTYYIMSLVSFAFGLFSKETVVTLPLALLACDLFFGEARMSRERVKWLLPYAGYIVILAFYLCMRLIAFGSLLKPDESTGQPAFSAFIEMQPRFLLYLFPPMDAVISDSTGEWLFVSGLALIVLTVVILRIWAKDSRARALYDAILYFGPVWYLISVLPLRALGHLADRHRYLPAVGVCVALTILIHRVARKRPPTVVATLLLSAGFGILLFRDNQQFRETSQLSLQVLRSVESLAQQAPSGSGLILDVPIRYRHVALWGWATPFVIRQPFSSTDMYERFQVLENPATYYRNSWVEDRLKVVRSLSEQPVDSYLIGVDDAGRPIIRQIDKEQVAKKLADFLIDLDDPILREPQQYAPARRIVLRKWRRLTDSLD